MNRLMIGFTVLLIFMVLSNSLKGQNQEDFDLLCNWMTGSFDSYHQSVEDSAFYNVSLKMVPIWTERDDAKFLYVEQAMSSALDKPYRQRVYVLSQLDKNSFQSAVYEIPNEEHFVNGYSYPEIFDDIHPQDLIIREGCDIVLTREWDTFVGSTGGDKCKSSLRGASYATSKVLVTADKISSWDQGWNETEEQVWGAVVGPYVFDRKFEMDYPQTAMVDTVDTYFGVEVADPYRWLEDELSAETEDWVNRQNEVTEKYLSQFPEREILAKRLEALYNYDRQGIPTKEGKYFYFSHNDGLQNQSPIYRSTAVGKKKELFLDPNKFSEDGTVSLAGKYFSQDGKYMAFLTSVGGSDWRTVNVMNTETKEVLKDTLKNVKFSGVSWLGDGFFYGRYDGVNEETKMSDSNTSRKVYYHKLGDPQEEDTLVFWNEEEPLRGAGATVTKDQQYVFISESSGTSNNKLFFAKAAEYQNGFQTLVDDFESNFWIVGSEGDDFYVLTNRDAPNYKVLKINAQKPDPEFWEELIPESENLLGGVYLAGEQLVLKYFENISDHLYVYSTKGKRLKEIPVPAFGGIGSVSAEQGERDVYYSYSSPTRPSTTYHYNLKSEKQTAVFEPQLNFDPEELETTQATFKSLDGTLIPMFITKKKNIVLDGNNPTVLYGYGGFNISIKPAFQSAIIPFLESGGIYVRANLRGGGEFGEDWHEAGMKLNKQNVFDDFIAAAEYLVAEKFTSSEKLCISGRSNGGLLVGAVMCQRPELFKAALPAVGVMDMLRYEQFTIGWAWANEYGSVSEEEQFKNIFTYSPLHNLKNGEAYPATLVTTANRDDRVVPAHSYKFAAALQKAQRGANPCLIRVDTKAGHGNGKSIQQQINENADIWTFVFEQLGVEVSP